MTNPIDLRDSFRVKVFITTVVLTATTLFVASLANLSNQYIIGFQIQVALVVLLLFTIPFALKKKHLETLSNIVVYTIAITLLFNATQIGGTDPGPYIGLIALLIISGLLTVHKHSFVTYATIVYLLFLPLSIGGYVEIQTSVNIKFQAVYIVLVILIVMHKRYLDFQNKELFSLSQRAHKEGLKANKKAEVSQIEVKTQKQQKAELAKQNRLLAAQKKELAEVNKLMVGREEKMIELKKEIQEYKQRLSKPLRD
jgi:hypothetical protein